MEPQRRIWGPNLSIGHTIGRPLQPNPMPVPHPNRLPQLSPPGKSLDWCRFSPWTFLGSNPIPSQGSFLMGAQFLGLRTEWIWSPEPVQDYWAGTWKVIMPSLKQGWSCTRGVLRSKLSLAHTRGWHLNPKTEPDLHPNLNPKTEPDPHPNLCPQLSPLGRPQNFLGFTAVTSWDLTLNLGRLGPWP